MLIDVFQKIWISNGFVFKQIYLTIEQILQRELKIITIVRLKLFFLKKSLLTYL